MNIKYKYIYIYKARIPACEIERTIANAGKTKTGNRRKCVTQRKRGRKEKRPILSACNAKRF